tara:strand:+ start:36 stop:347 length:312 start_codon:yes stop_codon:yes gene_type:complete
VIQSNNQFGIGAINMTFTIDFGSHTLAVCLDPENASVVRNAEVGGSSHMESFEIVNGKSDVAEFCNLRVLDVLELFGGSRFLTKEDKPEEVETNVVSLFKEVN